MSLTRDDGDFRRANATRSLLTELHGPDEAYKLSGVHCRVCSLPIRGGIDSYRCKPWGIEYAHAKCGWFRVRFHAQEITLVRRPGTMFEFFEWRCPECKLDAAHVRSPQAGDDLRCKRCRPIAVFEAGSKVETSIGLRLQRPNSKSVILPQYTRAVILRLADNRAHVRVVDSDLEFWTPMDKLTLV